MARIVDEKQQENLNRYGIEIQTEYFDGDSTIIKSTAEKNNDKKNIQSGIILDKIFFKNGVPIKRLDQYDARMQYRFVASEDEEKVITCPNCGYSAKGTEFVDGCPYCKTFYNMDYKDKSLGTKYFYDYVMKSDHYILITFIVDLVFSLLAVLSYIVVTGRTFNGYDMAKVIIGGILLAVLFFAVFYVLDAFVLMLPIKRVKEKQNQKQMQFWNKMDKYGVDKNKLLNNFHYEIRNHMYEDPQLIDYDILDYIEYKDKVKEDQLEVKITYDIRRVLYQNEAIQTKEERQTSTLIRRKKTLISTKEGVNLISCTKCGASVQVTDGKCAFCGTRINAYQEWSMV